MDYKKLAEELAEHFGYKLVENYDFSDVEEADAEIDFITKEIRLDNEVKSGWEILLCIHELGHHILDNLKERRNNELTAWMMGLYYFKRLPKFRGKFLSLNDAFELFMEGMFIGKQRGDGKVKAFEEMDE